MPILIARAGRSIPILAALALITTRSASAHAGGYSFEKIADSIRDNFVETTFSGANINKHGEVAFGATRLVERNGQEEIVNGAFRRNKNGTLTTIAVDGAGTPFEFIQSSPTINDSGQVAFGAILAGEESVQAILIGSGCRLTTIASTAGSFFSISPTGISLNKTGTVAFNATLDSFDSGLFSGSGRAVTTHYLTSFDVILDGHPARFNESFFRPSINKAGNIAVATSLAPDFTNGVFVGQRGRFKTITQSSSAFFGDPVLNDQGTVVFLRADENGVAIVVGNGGPLTTIVDTNGPFDELQTPSINNKGDVVFFARFANVTTSGLFTGPDPVRDKVIATGDTIGGATVLTIGSFGQPLGERAINDAGQVAFIALLEDPDVPAGVRSVIFRATPKH